MEINLARKIQKQLYLSSICGRKRMRTMINKGRLFYTVSHYIGENCAPLYLYKDRIKQLIELGIDFEVRYIDNIPHIPKGMYIGEIIPID